LSFTAFIEEGVPAMTINPPRYRRSFHGPLHGVRYAKAFLDAELQKVGFAVEQFEYATEPDGQSVIYAKHQ
jgi:hypothetical protein